jgi:hypothetical protein
VEIEMSQTELYQWMSEIIRNMPSLGKWQGLNLALFSVGVILSERTSVQDVAKWLWELGSRASVEKRLKRFLSNSGLAWAELQVEWVSWVLRFLNVTELVLLVDETKLGKYLSVMMVGLAYRQRCIPLVWHCYHPKHYPSEGQVQLILKLLQVVKAALPEQARPLVQADRGIGTSPRLLRGIMKLKWHYLVRVQNRVRLRTFRHKAHRLCDLVKRGESWSGQGFVFKKHDSLRAFVHVYWDWQERDMWCLLTNDPSLQYHAYAIRNWQEQGFRDLKSGGFNWQRSQVRLPDHAQRLLLVLALAYARVVSFTSFAPADTQPVYLRVSRRSRPQFSIFSRGLSIAWDRLVRHCIPYLGISLLPNTAVLNLLC